MNGPEFDSLKQDLRALAEADAQLSAPPRVEQALLAVFRERRAGPKVVAIRPPRRIWAMAAAAVVLAAVRISMVQPPKAPAVPAAAVMEAAEVMTGFYPLVPEFDPDLAEYQPTVRVQMPRTVLASFGLPVDVERIDVPVKADLVIGDDGVARGIRFVSTRAN